MIITCPICKKRYNLTPKNPDTLMQKTFSCPNCKYTAPFATVINTPGGQMSKPDYGMGAHAGIHSPTKVLNNPSGQSKAYLTVIGSNMKFVLNQGVYVLGRKSSDSTATMQIAPDITMSRQHARLAVRSVGGKMMAQITSLKANNPIYINGKAYSMGQPCTLKPGDNLQMGSTRLVYTI